MAEFYEIPAGKEEQFNIVINRYKAIKPVPIRNGNFIIDKDLIDSLSEEKRSVIKMILSRVVLKGEEKKQEITIRQEEEIEFFTWEDDPELVQMMSR